MTSSLVLPSDVEFLEGLTFLCGDGALADIKRQLILIALDVIRNSFLGRVHPLETLQSLSDLHSQELIVNPRTTSGLHQLLDALEIHPRLQGVIEILRQPIVMQRLRIEWLYEISVGRFEHSIRFLHKEEELLRSWEKFCGELRESSGNPFDAAEKEAQRLLSSRGELSDPAQRLYRLSFLAASRKLFVHFSGAKETWAGPYSIHSFKLNGTLADQTGRVTRDVQGGGGHLVLRFGQVDHVFYLKPSLEQLQLYLDCIKDPELSAAVQYKLCPFICANSEDMNFLAEVFYHVYLPDCVREMHKPSHVDTNEDFLRDSGMHNEFFRRFHFLPLNAEAVATLSEKLEEMQQLRAFLHQPRTGSGLVRQRLLRGILDPMLADVVQKALLSLCRQWNPLLRTEEGGTLSLMNLVENKVSRIIGDDPKAALLRERLFFDELVKILERNTQSWREAFAKDGFVVDRSRNYFMTVLDKAIDESRSQQTRRESHEDVRRIACVVVE